MLQTHLVLSECVSSIELAGIMGMELKLPVHVTDEEGDTIEVTISIRSILMGIEITSSGTPKPLFLMIAKSHDGEYEGILPTGRERGTEAARITTYAASATMYRLMFHQDAESDNIAQFIRVKLSEEHVKIAMMHSSYEMKTGIVTLHQRSNQHNYADMQDMVGED